MSKFKLVKRVQLPNFADQSSILMVWRKREEPVELTQALRIVRDVSLPVACSYCGGMGSGNLSRCRYCREVAYCSTRCRDAHTSAHAHIHEERIIIPAGHEYVSLPVFPTR